MKATLRKRLIDNGTRYSLRLDIYPPAPHPETGKFTRFVNLGMSLHVNPKTSEARLENKETMALANAILAKTQLQLHAGRYEFMVSTKPVDFIAFYIKLGESKLYGKPKPYSWNSALQSLRNYLQLKPDQPLYFSQLDKNLLEGFRSYLISNHAINTANLLFAHFRTSLNYAYRHDLMKVKLTEYVKAIPRQQTKIIYLTLDELNRLYKAPCKKEIIKEAALFSALTGMRLSDIVAMKWEDIVDEPTGPCIHFTQRKTKAPNYLPISAQALKLLGKRKSGATGIIFPKLNSNYKNYAICYFEKWVLAAGIEKHVTFHTMRHTFATLQLLANTNIKTLSEMLGHADINTTMIYAHVVNASRRDAADAIILDMGEDNKEEK
jgi:integrase